MCFFQEFVHSTNGHNIFRVIDEKRKCLIYENGAACAGISVTLNLTPILFLSINSCSRFCQLNSFHLLLRLRQRFTLVIQINSIVKTMIFLKSMLYTYPDTYRWLWPLWASDGNRVPTFGLQRRYAREAHIIYEE